jgi:hypothetical protein
MNNALSNNRPTRGRDDASMYDVSTYTDVELFNILDVDSPTDRELEAKIIFLINKYRNVQNASGDQLAEFFEKIYRRFFEAEAEEEEGTENFANEDEDDGFANIREGLSNQEIVKLTTSPANKVTNITNTTGPTSAITVNPTAQANSVVKQSPDNIGYTKTLEYANGKLNPLLQQTIKRIISIDSQYRDDKRTLSTEFTFNLSDPLKDVVSLKLYSVQIPYTWYTINNNFGSNFFVLKGDVAGINNGNHDYQIDIAAGNYSPQSLTDTINESINLAKTTYSDVSFGNTVLSYNSNTSLITTTFDLYKQYNETSYYLNFPTKWSGVTTDAVRLSTIPGFLGFTQETYEMFHLESERTLPSSKDTANENTRFAIDSTNNYFTAYKYIGDEYDDNQLGKRIDLTLNIVFGLADGSYTRSQLTTALNVAIQNNKYLSTTETLIERKSGIQRIDLSNNSYFILKLKSNRNTTNNLEGSKIQVLFPLEIGSDKKIWSGINSCFQFNPNSSRVMEMNNLISEQSPMQESDSQYTIASSPYISLVCKSKGYDVANTRYKIKVDNAITVPYNLTNYINAINNGFATVDNSSNFTIDNTLVKIDNRDTFNAQIDLTRNITTPAFKLDLSGSFLHTDLNFASSYNLDLSGGVYTATFGFKNNYTIPSTSTKLATFSGRNAGAFMTTDLSYTVMHPSNKNIDASNNTASTPYVTGLERTLEVTINQQFENFKDSDSVNVLSGTNIRLVANPDNTVTATLTVSVNKQLTESDYSIQFLEDISFNITQTGFKLDVDGGVPTTGKYITNVGGAYDLSDEFISSGLGVLSNIFDLSSGGINGYDMQTVNLFTSQFDTSDIPNNPFIIDTSYIAFLAVALNPAVDTPYYGRSFRYGSTVPYGYLIQSPVTRTYNTINGLVSAINTQFNLYPDLSGTLLTINNISGTRYNASLRVVVNQRYNQDTWYKNLKISRQMIDASWNLSNIADLSLAYTTENASGSVALGIKGESIIVQKAFACNATNNTFELIPYEEGVISTNNNLTFTLPLKNTDGTTVTYTRTRLLDEINNQFLGTVAAGSTVSIITSDTGVEYTKFRITINKEYTSKDYRIVYYDPYSFVKCFSGVNSVRNVTWDTTLGWILGYRLSTIYYLSDYTSTRTVTITGDTSISTNLFNYFLITLDDYNQNHLNDGLVTVTAKDTDIPLPSYANRTNYTCDPVTKELTYNTEQRTDYSKLTQNQIYALNQVANSKNTLTNQVTAGEVSSKNYGSGPFAKDVFGIIPLKLAGLQNGTSFVEFGGTLQNQERIYFGPVNIHRMSVKLLSDRGNVVDLNGANWSFSLVCEQLYRPQQRE